MNDLSKLIFDIATAPYTKQKIDKSMDEFFKDSHIDKLHRALCSDDLPEYYLDIYCAWCGEYMGIRECDKKMHLEQSHGICPSCAVRHMEQRSEKEVIIENIKNNNTPIEIVKTYIKGDVNEKEQVL